MLSRSSAASPSVAAGVRFGDLRSVGCKGALRVYGHKQALKQP